MVAERRASTQAGDRRDRLFVGGVALVGLAIALVDTLSIVHDRADDGRPIAFWEPMVWETTSVAVMVALAPAVMNLARRVRPLEAPWSRVLVFHALGALAFSAAHLAAMGVLRWALYALVGGHYSPLGPLGDFPYEFRKDLLTYAALVTLYVGWLRLQRASPAPSEALEVRDGARRHFVDLADVAWIEAAGNYVELHRGGAPILYRAPLSQLERRLADRGFVRIHRSRLVRRGAVAQVESKPSGDFVVRLADGRELAGSRRYRRPLLEP